MDQPPGLQAFNHYNVTYNCAYLVVEVNICFITNVNYMVIQVLFVTTSKLENTLAHGAGNEIWNFHHTLVKYIVRPSYLVVIHISMKYDMECPSHHDKLYNGLYMVTQKIHTGDSSCKISSLETLHTA